MRHQLLYRAPVLALLLPFAAQAVCPEPTLAECQSYTYQSGVCWTEKRSTCESLIDAAYQAERATLTRTRSVLVPKDLSSGTDPVATREGVSTEETTAAIPPTAYASVYARGSTGKYSGVVQKTRLFELSPTAYLPQTSSQALSSAVASFSRTAVVPTELLEQIGPLEYTGGVPCTDWWCLELDIDPRGPVIPIIAPGTQVGWPLSQDVARIISLRTAVPRPAINDYVRVLADAPGARQMAEAKLSLYDPRHAWEKDGRIVRSCEEYVWQRYTTFSRFEAKAAELGGDYTAIFDLAYNLSSPGISSRPVRDELGNTTLTFSFPPRSPKNSFFSWRWDRPENFGYPSSTPGSQRFDWTAPARLPRIAKLSAGYDFWSWNWGTLRTEGEWYLANFHVDRLEELDGKKYAFEQLVAKRQAAHRAYHDAHQVLQRQVTCKDSLGLPLYGYACASVIPGVAELDAKVAAELYALDTLIDLALQEADTLGCLSATRNACDWSPRGFLRMVTQLADGPRERDFARCVAVTGNNFGAGSRLATIEAEGITKAGILPGDYNASSVALTSMMNQLSAYITAIKAKFPIDPATGKPKLGASDSDEQSIGSGIFGAGYKYNVGWELMGFGTGARFSDANIHVWSRFSASVSVLGGTTELIDAVAEVRPEGEVQFAQDFHARVLGADLFTPRTGTTPDPTWNVVLSGGVKRKLAETYAIIVIVAVPVKLSAGVAGELGFSANLHASVDRMEHEEPSKDGIGLVVEGSGGPRMGLDGFAAAAVELLVVRAGIKGELTLLSIELPLTMNVTIKATTASTFILEGTTSMDLVLRALSGRIAVFIESIFGDTEHDLVNWTGLEMKERVFEQRLDPVSLTELNAAFTGIF